MQAASKVTTNLRVLAPGDFDWLFGQLKQFSDFYGSKHQLFNDGDYAESLLHNLLENHIFLVAENSDGELLGFIAGLKTPHLYNPNITVLAECFWWVAEEHRKGRVGYMLLKEFIARGKEVADWVTLALDRHSPVKDESLEKLGFKLYERNFVLEV